MNNTFSVDVDSGFSLSLRLPNIAFTRNGIAFNPNEDVWEWTDGPFHLYLDFRKVSMLTSIPRDSIKHTLLVFAKMKSASHVSNLFGAFIHFLMLRKCSTPLESISILEVSNYAARLQDHQKYRVGVLNVLIQKWVALCLPGVEPDCAQYLSERRIPGNAKGEAVRTRDPVAGPFSEAEYNALYKAVDVAYGVGDIPFWVAVLTRLLFACGGRISQYACLKMLDVTEINGTYTLNLPQAKTRDVHSRVSFKTFDLSPQTGRLVVEYINSLKLLGFDVESALFPENIVMKKGHQKIRRDESDIFYGHCTSPALARVHSVALQAIAPPTERLQFQAIPITSKRFRYTFGTRLAEEGASKAVIADRLGHADLQNVDVYFEASPKIVENIDKAMDDGLAPLAEAFTGRLVEDEQHTTHKGALGSRIIDFRVTKQPVGSCGGKGKGCAFNKPIACYTCFKFEAWLDAPHEKVLRHLQAERERWVNDERLAAINDAAILAVRQVIAECDQVWEQRKSGVPA